MSGTWLFARVVWLTKQEGFHSFTLRAYYGWLGALTNGQGSGLQMYLSTLGKKYCFLKENDKSRCLFMLEHLLSLQYTVRIWLWYWSSITCTRPTNNPQRPQQLPMLLGFPLQSSNANLHFLHRVPLNLTRGKWLCPSRVEFNAC